MAVYKVEYPHGLMGHRVQPTPTETRVDVGGIVDIIDPRTGKLKPARVLKPTRDGDDRVRRGGRTYTGTNTINGARIEGGSSNREVAVVEVISRRPRPRAGR